MAYHFVNSTYSVERAVVYSAESFVADWVDRLKAIGNGQVPSVARLAWEILK